MIKINENSRGKRKILKKKLSKCKIFMMKFEKKMRIERNWAFLFKLEVWSLPKEWNGRKNEIYKHLSII